MSKHYTFGWKTVRQVIAKTNGKCFYCGCDLPADTEFFDEYGNLFSSVRNWHVDHILPLSKGGNHKIDNLVPACRTCNLSKYTKTADEFIATRAL